jgi:hypothetical protein
MSRNRIYSSAAERQKAYRERKAGQSGAVSPQPATAKKRRSPSRPKRLAFLIKELQELLTEYEDWRHSLPESLEGTDQYEELTETIDLIIQAAEPLEMIQPPLGFGRVRR